jgi:peptide/nickel transport system permease protein
MLRRLIVAVPTLVLVSVGVFGLIHLAPGGPLGTGPGEDGLRPLPAHALTELRALYHLDQSVTRRYGLWLQDLSRGDLGRSFQDRRPVTTRISERLGLTLSLNGAVLLLTALVAVPLGAIAARRPGALRDRALAVLSSALFAVPVFWAGLLLQMIVALRWGWLPIAGARSPTADDWGSLAQLLDRARHLALPVLCLSYGSVAYVSRFVRASLLEGSVAESWRAARARGLSEWSILRHHALPQAALPLLTLAGFLLPGLFAGSVIVETLFALPGIGRLFFEAAMQRDMPVLMGLTLLSAVATVVGMLAADVAASLADPRVRRG